MKKATIEYTKQEFEALAGLIDAGIRATGLRGVKDAAAMLEKMEAAGKVFDEEEVE